MGRGNEHRRGSLDVCMYNSQVESVDSIGAFPLLAVAWVVRIRVTV